MWRRRVLQAVRSSAATFFSSGRSIGSQWRRLISNAAVPGRRYAALWGNGDYGRLALGGLESQWKPSVCTFFADGDDEPVAVACGGAHTLFLTEKGRVYSSGLNSFGQLGTAPATSHALEPLEISGLPSKIVKVSAGYYHSAAITEDGELFMWGKNSIGQLGLGKRSAKIISNPTRVDSLVGFHVKMVALGAEHSIAITEGGDILSWGEGGSGRLGHGHQSGTLGFTKCSSEYMPRLIKNFENVKVKKVAAGLLHSACIDDKGSIFVFGEPIMDKFGFRETKNASTPSIIYELPFSEEVACGGYHTCAITNGGELYSWGSNENGCLGLSSTGTFKGPERVESSLVKFPITEVSCGWKHTAAISGGNVFTWGWGGASGTFFEDGHSSGGQLGLGSDLDCFEPMMVDLGSDSKALQVSCGFNHTGVILEYT